jgi:hypothetical protein
LKVNIDCEIKEIKDLNRGMSTNVFHKVEFQDFNSPIQKIKDPDDLNDPNILDLIDIEKIEHNVDSVTPNGSNKELIKLTAKSKTNDDSLTNLCLKDPKRPSQLISPRKGSQFNLYNPVIILIK